MYTCSSWVEILSKRNEMYWVNTHSNRKRSSLFELDFTKIMIFVCTGECCIYIYMVGGIPTPLKIMSSSVDSVGNILPIWKNPKPCSKPPDMELS